MDLVKRSRSLQRKVLITAIVGAATFAATTAADQDPAWSWLLSVFVSGVTLVVQFLVELDGRVDAVRVEAMLRLDTSTLASASGTNLPMVIFDGAILYEQTPTRLPAAPGCTKTALILDASHVNAMAERFDQLWEAARE